MDIPVDHRADSGAGIVLEGGVGYILEVDIHLEDRSFEVAGLHTAGEEEGDLRIDYIVEVVGLHIAVDHIVVEERDYRIVGVEVVVPAANQVGIDHKEAGYRHRNSKIEVVHVDSFHAIHCLQNPDDQYG